MLSVMAKQGLGPKSSVKNTHQISVGNARITKRIEKQREVNLDFHYNHQRAACNAAPEVQ
ncbi:hypothetical protein CAter282_2047 [Collimonas arenae]|uniref:Uncharacterized protein n=1 Tax=Collimonas arenae TaxID=279058 RepID=A0A127PQ67_9BURK|nr:hypothetical protein CAter10_2226 [Collimonas arenae]AMP09808.1 hypothetical protein CAter282_2047 [Collimonas arenae]